MNNGSFTNVIRAVSLMKPGGNVVKIHKIIDCDVEFEFFDQPFSRRSISIRVAYNSLGIQFMNPVDRFQGNHVVSLPLQEWMKCSLQGRSKRSRSNRWTEKET